MSETFVSPKSVAVIGCGSIGASWAALFAYHGLKVQVYDPSAAAKSRLDNLIKDASTTFSKLSSSEYGSVFSKTSSNVTFTTNLQDALAGAEFVQENCPEDIDVKTDLYIEIEKTLPSHIPILTSTSGLSVSRMAEIFTHPTRFAVGHPFNPPHLMPLVEVVGSPSTSSETINFAMEFYRSIGKEPIHLKKEVPGHIANRLQAALFREIMHLISEDVATVADIEKAMCFGPGLRWGVMGPSTIFHLGGGPAGVDHFSKHIMKPMLGWYAPQDPNFDENLRSKWVQQTEEAVSSQNLSFEQLCQMRDSGIVDILQWRKGR